MDEQHQKMGRTKNNEIDIFEIFKLIWANRKVVYWAVSICIVIGLFIAFTTPRQYKVVTTMLPQSDEGVRMGGLSSLAAIAGFDIDLSDNGSEISPVIYPQIMESETFLLDLMHTKYTFKELKQPTSLFDYYTKYAGRDLTAILRKYTVDLVGTIKESLKKKKPITQGVNDGLTRMSEDEYNIAKGLKGCITLTINKKEGYLTLTSIFEQDILTAQVAKRAQQLLQETITAYKTKRANEQLEFFEKRYIEKKIEYQKAQSRLASYKDRNLYVTSATGSSQETQLLNDYNLAFSVYTELAKQFENAKIKVKRVTPVYIILKPVVVPNEPFAPKKTIILLVSIVLGGLFGGGYVVTKDVLRKKRQQTKSE
jgi:uncharacterized protein involved in exopolysaccharide biosynthesis